jgi:hypothetical protein
MLCQFPLTKVFIYLDKNPASPRGRTQNPLFGNQGLPKKKGYSPHKRKKLAWIGNHIFRNISVPSDTPARTIPSGGRYG